MTGSQPHSIQDVAVLGTSPALGAIAQVMATAGYGVTLCAAVEVLESARVEIDGGRFGLAASADAGKISSDERARALDRLRYREDRAGAATADLAIVTHRGEAAELAGLLEGLEGCLQPHALLAVDSQGVPLEALTAGLARPERLVGWHWGWPPQVSKLAEIVAGATTADDAADSVVQVARRAGKNPIVIADAPESWGYVTNRLWATLHAEAARIVAEGVAGPEEVDRLLIDGFGWPAGPFGRGSEAR